MVWNCRISASFQGRFTRKRGLLIFQSIGCYSLASCVRKVRIAPPLSRNPDDIALPAPLGRPFLIVQHELTLALWNAVMGTSPFVGARSNPCYDLPGMAARIDRPDHPATISWDESQEFIHRLNEACGARRQMALHRRGLALVGAARLCTGLQRHQHRPAAGDDGRVSRDPLRTTT
jgi:hypothetical protein